MYHRYRYGLIPAVIVAIVLLWALANVGGWSLLLLLLLLLLFF